MRFRGYRIGKLLIVKRGPQPAHLLVGRLSLRFGHARKARERICNPANVAIATAIRATTTALAMIVLSSTSITMVLPYRTPVYGLEKIACQIEASAGCKASRTWDQIVVVAAASTDRSVTLVPCLRASREVNAISAISES